MTYYKVPSTIKGEYCKLTEVDLFKIAAIIDETLFKKYPLIFSLITSGVFCQLISRMLYKV